MQEQLFIRIRGRILGPYDQEKLKSLVKRGQLSRLHEVSTDGVTWSRASQFADLFTAAAAAPPAGLDGEQNNAPKAGQHPFAPAARQGWHYTLHGAQQGPVDFTQLQMLASTGQVTGDDLVWVQGMTNWAPARQVPGLIADTVSANGSGSTAASPFQHVDVNALPPALCRAAIASRPWATFIAVVFFVHSVMYLAGGVVLLATGTGVFRATSVASGIISFIQAALAVAGGALLLCYVNRLGALRHAPQAHILEQSLDWLRSFWIFVSIVLIVMLAFLTVLVIWLFSIGVTIADLRG